MKPALFLVLFGLGLVAHATPLEEFRAAMMRPAVTPLPTSDDLYGPLPAVTSADPAVALEELAAHDRAEKSRAASSPPYLEALRDAGHVSRAGDYALAPATWLRAALISHPARRWGKLAHCAPAEAATAAFDSLHQASLPFAAMDPTQDRRAVFYLEVAAARQDLARLRTEPYDYEGYPHLWRFLAYLPESSTPELPDRPKSSSLGVSALDFFKHKAPR
jgi:hypothetical protein